jgi:uncharacterized protein
VINYASRCDVTRLALFGSLARDAARDDSDADVQVAFDGPASSLRYFGVRFYLEDLFARPVDHVTEKAIRPELRPHVELEAIMSDGAPRECLPLDCVAFGSQ